MSRLAVLPLAALALAACKGYAPAGFKESMKLGGKVIPAETLEHGERAYTLYCRSCHGDKGDGKGPAAKALRPPPRDFTQGIFKFAAVPGGTLPSDEDLVRIVTAGLHGTAMLAWDGVPDQDVRAIIQYIKTLSPRWKDEEPGEVIKPTPDPWKGKEAEGISRGRALYHGLAQCSGCHPAYISRQGIDEASRQLTGNPTTDFRDDMYGSSLKDSDFGVKILPPDFTRTPLRSIRPQHRLEDLYRVVAAGVGGTAMPTWRGMLPESDLWALVHYVDSLVAMDGTDAPRKLLEANLATDATWNPAPAKP